MRCPIRGPARRRSRPIPGAGASPAIRRRGSPARPTAPRRAATQVDAFFGGGADEWNYRRMILHYAAAGGRRRRRRCLPDRLGAESLTRVRSASGVYPAVDAARHARRRREGDRRRRHASSPTAPTGPNTARMSSMRTPTRCAFRSIRCGRRARSMPSASTITRRSPTGATAPDHLDRALAASIYRSRLSHRQPARRRGLRLVLRRRTRRARRRRAAPITDGLGKPWMFRQKDIWSFWSNAALRARRRRRASAAPTAWVPQSKPIWLTEIGCPAVDKGANQPSVFPDPKSSESGFPYFSNGGATI